MDIKELSGKIHVVLVNPQIPWNTGNIGRTCVATGASLHLVGELGFSLSDAQLKRAGLDYWKKLCLSRYKSFDGFLSSLARASEIFLFSKKAKRSFWEASFGKMNYLVFGSETDGLPCEIHSRYPDKLFRIPQTEDVRALNLSTAVGIVVYEALRQLHMK